MFLQRYKIKWKVKREKRKICFRAVFFSQLFRIFGRKSNLSLFKGSSEDWVKSGLRTRDCSQFHVLHQIAFKELLTQSHQPFYDPSSNAKVIHFFESTKLSAIFYVQKLILLKPSYNAVTQSNQSRGFVQTCFKCSGQWLWNTDDIHYSYSSITCHTCSKHQNLQWSLQTRSQ